MNASTPGLLEFDPRVIPFQFEVIRDVRKNFDYDLGVHEILCSGAVGSSKTLLGAHLGVTHCIQNRNARLCVGRKTMPSLKDTLLKKIIEHIDKDRIPYVYNKSRGVLSFPNGSQIIPISWGDNATKFRSYEFTAAIVEELTENDDIEFYHELLMRVGRLSHVKEKWVMSLTNPDDPAHPAYKYFIANQSPTRHVYYSVTKDNPFLPESYVRQLQSILDPKMARRMLHGEWLSITDDVVYYAYEREKNFKNEKYKLNPHYPIHITFDFNIGDEKPLSACLFQYINKEFHFFAEVVIHGSRTLDALEELASRGIFEQNHLFIINGDATGKHRDTRSKHSDYSIIKEFLDHTKNKSGYVRYRVDVPLSNPKVRERHNTVNGQICNSLGERRVFVYAECPVLDEGMRLTKLKTGANYIEDDSKYYQHVTTAAGYGIMATLREENSATITMTQR